MPGGAQASVLAQASEGCRNADRADLCPDDRGPVSVPEESRGRLFSGVAKQVEIITKDCQHKANDEQAGYYDLGQPGYQTIAFANSDTCKVVKFGERKLPVTEVSQSGCKRYTDFPSL